MDCILQTPAAGPQEGLVAESLIRELGFDGVNLAMAPESLSTDAESITARIEALRAADLTVPLASSNITRPEQAEDLFALCDETNVRKVRVGFWDYEFPGYWPQVKLARRQLEDLQDLADSVHLRVIVPTNGPGHLQAGCAATYVWLQDCDSRLVGVAVAIDLAGTSDVPAMGLEMVAEYLALIEVPIASGGQVDRARSETLARVLTEIDYTGPVCLIPSEGVPVDQWSADAKAQLDLIRDTLDLQPIPDAEPPDEPEAEDIDAPAETNAPSEPASEHVDQPEGESPAPAP